MNSTSPNKSICLTFERFCQTIADAGDSWQMRKKDLENLINSKPLLLFGYGGKGQTLAHQIRMITGRELTIFDSSASKREAARTHGFRTVDQFSLRDGAQWATILGACQAQFEQKIAVEQNFIYYQEAANLLGAPHLSHLASDFETYIHRDLEGLYETYQALHSDSQDRFVQVLCFRVSCDPTYLQLARQAAKEMWLDIPSRFKRRDYRTFLDVGAFDGDTLRFFNQRFGCDRGIAVEANTSLFDSIREVANLYQRGIDIMPKAAWSSSTRLKFEEVRYGMIKVKESVEGQLEAAPIDSYVNEPVDVLKMDIEGAEAHALAGCKAVLNHSMPDLAIAAYHRPEDFVDLYSQLVGEGYGDGDFSWHLGHYSDCLDDSIFYVIQSH